MKLRVRGIELPLGRTSESKLREAVVRCLGLRVETLLSIEVVRRSLDARKARSRPAWVYTLDIDCSGRPVRKPRGVSWGSVPERPLPQPTTGDALKGLDVMVVGSGPAGLFSALHLSLNGADVTVIEGGPPMKDRVASVAKLWRRGELNPEANVQFGEGGAGTFSDGKLRTRVKNPKARNVLEAFVLAGASSSILEEAHPHLGTDGVRKVVRGLRAAIETAGASFRFRERLLDVKASRRGGYEVTLADGTVHSDALFMAVGHSSRVLIRRLAAIGVPFKPKGFAVGVRVEHPQKWVDLRRYGAYAGHPDLPPAEYILSFKAPSGRGVYSFCMCPGGLVVNSASEEGRLVTNGMSMSGRLSGMANSAIVVTVSPADLGEGLFNGFAFQEQLERRAFELGGGGYYAPAQSVRAFIDGRVDEKLPRTTFKPGARPVNLRGFFPGWIEDSLSAALLRFDRRMPGFIAEGLLLAPETRTSSPLQVVRSSDDLSVQGFPGLYLVGEASGRSGGIVSSAVDALCCVEAFVQSRQ